ncbi:GNAT family N-acetyltransferase [Comamonas sp. B-9]|uniref:GNAT family N-acetyltransferase n=1 Tax=Comamonas sp. B-9 TaxID=1055192 RepID=UPI000395CE40|nr:GNAT family N-acetyltransferase [Comamonas sp. B-9]
MPANLTFRTATLADLPAIIALLADDALGREREVLADPPDARYIAAFDAICADANQRLVVAELDGQVVGTLQLSFVPGLSHTGAWRGQIESVRIAAQLRGAGAGQQMLEWAVAQCRARGCTVVQLTTDKSRADAHRFYEKLGFVSSHLGFKRKL